MFNHTEAAHRIHVLSVYIRVYKLSGRKQAMRLVREGRSTPTTKLWENLRRVHRPATVQEVWAVSHKQWAPASSNQTRTPITYENIQGGITSRQHASNYR